MRANIIVASAGRLPAVARRIGIAVLLAALALVGRGVAVDASYATPYPAKVWVINGNVAAATAAVPVAPSTFASALTSSAARADSCALPLAARRVRRRERWSAFPRTLLRGNTFIVYQTDGSLASMSLNGRGLVCSPACDGITTVSPDATDNIVVFEVTGNGTRWPGDLLVATAIQDSVSLDSRTITVVGQAHDLVLFTAKSTIPKG